MAADHDTVVRTDHADGADHRLTTVEATRCDVALVGFVPAGADGGAVEVALDEFERELRRTAGGDGA